MSESVDAETERLQYQWTEGYNDHCTVRAYRYAGEDREVMVEDEDSLSYIEDDIDFIQMNGELVVFERGEQMTILRAQTEDDYVKLEHCE